MDFSKIQEKNINLEEANSNLNAEVIKSYADLKNNKIEKSSLRNRRDETISELNMLKEQMKFITDHFRVENATSLTEAIKNDELKNLIRFNHSNNQNNINNDEQIEWYREWTVYKKEEGFLTEFIKVVSYIEREDFKRTKYNSALIKLFLSRQIIQSSEHQNGSSKKIEYSLTNKGFYYLHLYLIGLTSDDIDHG
ncbi:hypothetical protein LX97_02726 [Nonlabens dokdonensis]|uniref:Uncharacterized protein n=2 Tax=Nonlabens dokdonensis TaxID=328515 RepID=L7WEP3_NONDD|nr:hypothetical protein [Nonlabens dokdonensis]AGC78396.1 hypothetical protein DDD_3269 [Nonlabens dokdonensis DSW-6]PZX38145.1 hypothetical protein LX97_02726 [Nonlabens dokdonensis]